MTWRSSRLLLVSCLAILVIFLSISSPPWTLSASHNALTPIPVPAMKRADPASSPSAGAGSSASGSSSSSSSSSTTSSTSTTTSTTTATTTATTSTHTDTTSTSSSTTKNTKGSSSNSSTAPPGTTQSGSNTVPSGTSQTSSTKSGDAGATTTPAPSSVGESTIIGLAVSGGIAAAAVIAFIIWKVTRKSRSRFDDDGEAIKWPVLSNDHHALPVRPTGRSGIESPSSRPHSVFTSDTAANSTADMHYAADPYAVAPFPHQNPNQPYRDDPQTSPGQFYDPYGSSWIPQPGERLPPQEWGVQPSAESIPMTVYSSSSRSRSPGPALAYGDGRQSPGPSIAYSGRQSPGPAVAYGIPSPGPAVAYAGRQSPGPAVGLGDPRRPSPGPGQAYGVVPGRDISPSYTGY